VVAQANAELSDRYLDVPLVVVGMTLLVAEEVRLVVIVVGPTSPTIPLAATRAGRHRLLGGPARDGPDLCVRLGGIAAGLVCSQQGCLDLAVAASPDAHRAREGLEHRVSLPWLDYTGCIYTEVFSEG